MRFLTIWDIVLLPVYLLIIYFISHRYQEKKKLTNPEYQYYVRGLFAKILGGIGVCLIYAFYYVGGDTIGYSEGSTYLSRVMTSDPGCWFQIMFDNRSHETWMCFNSETGWPMYFDDGKSFSVIRFTNLLSFFGFRSFILTTVLVAWITFPGMWKLFRLFYEQFPHQKKVIALSVLFVPSVCFWGSAILKDSYTISASAWLVYGFYRLFMSGSWKEKTGKQIAWFILVITVSIYVLISLKPYIFLSVFVGILLMLTHRGIKRMDSNFMKILFVPIVLVTVWGGGYFMLNQIAPALGNTYSSVDAMLEKAVVTQQDLKTSMRYGDNTFDIGNFDASLSGIFSKSPQAILAGLYRPFLWECNNPVMFISGTENFLLIFVSFYVIVLSVVAFIKLGFKYMYRTAFDHSLIVFSIIFSFSFAFFIGLTTANFGALVRYKIPLIPFLLTSAFVIIDRFNRSKGETKLE